MEPRSAASDLVPAHAAMAPDDAAEGMLKVPVRDMAGERVEVEVERGRLVFDVKERIDIMTRIPRIFQKLILPPLTILEDYIQVEDLELDEGAELLLVVCLDTAREYFRSGNSRRQCEALANLSFLGRRGGEASIDLVCSQLGSYNCDVRRVARCSFERVASRDDPYAIAAACDCFKDDNWRARCGGVAALERIARPGDRDIIDIIAARLSDTDGRVRQEAVNSLSRLADQGDSMVIDTLGRVLNDEYFWLRQSVVQAITHIAKKNDPLACSLISTRLEDDDDTVRATAKESLRKISDSVPDEELLWPDFADLVPDAVTQICRSAPCCLSKLLAALRRLV